MEKLTSSTALETITLTWGSLMMQYVATKVP